jgi:hypothetical protein
VEIAAPPARLNLRNKFERHRVSRCHYFLLASLSVQRNPLSMCCFLVSRGNGDLGPPFRPQWGYHFSNGATAQYDPPLGLHGGVRLITVVTAEHDPSLDPNGDIVIAPGQRCTMCPVSTVAIKRCINNANGALINKAISPGESQTVKNVQIIFSLLWTTGFHIR